MQCEGSGHEILNLLPTKTYSSTSIPSTIEIPQRHLRQDLVFRYLRENGKEKEESDGRGRRVALFSGRGKEEKCHTSGRSHSSDNSNNSWDIREGLTRDNSLDDESSQGTS